MNVLQFPTAPSWTILVHPDANFGVSDKIVAAIAGAQRVFIGHFINSVSGTAALYSQADALKLRTIVGAVERQLRASDREVTIEAFTDVCVVGALSHEGSGYRTHRPSTYAIRRLTDQLGIRRYPGKYLVAQTENLEIGPNRVSIAVGFVHGEDEQLRPRQFPGYICRNDLCLRKRD